MWWLNGVARIQFLAVPCDWRRGRPFSRCAIRSDISSSNSLCWTNSIKAGIRRFVSYGVHQTPPLTHYPPHSHPDLWSPTTICAWSLCSVVFRFLSVSSYAHSELRRLRTDNMYVQIAQTFVPSHVASISDLHIHCIKDSCCCCTRPSLSLVLKVRDSRS